AEWLEPFDQAAVDIYSARTGLEAKDIAKMLDRETWIGGAEAVEKGFADSLLSSDEIATKMERDAGRQVAALHKFDTLLARAGVSRSERRELLRALKGGTPSAAPAGMQDAAVIKEVEDLLAQIRSI